MHKHTIENTIGKAPQALIIDGGYDNGKIGLFETGDFLTSDFAGYNKIMQKNNDDSHMDMLLLTGLGKKYDRIIILNPPKVTSKFTLAIQECKSKTHDPDKYLEWDIPSYLNNTTEQIYSVIHQKIEQQSGYSGKAWCFVVNPEEDQSREASLLVAQNLQRLFIAKFPQTMISVLNSSSLTLPITHNKFLFMYFQNPENAVTHCFDLLNSDISKIKTAINQTQGPVVLKPLYASLGKGVNLISQKNYEKEISILKAFAHYRKEHAFDMLGAISNGKVIPPPPELISIIKKHNMQPLALVEKQYTYWFSRAVHETHQPLAVLQPYYPSKIINNRTATFRLVCIIYPDDSIALIDAYWKLALDKRKGSEITTKKIVSVTRWDSEVNFVPIQKMNTADKENIFKLVSDTMLPLYQKNPEESLNNTFKQLLEHKDGMVRNCVEIDKSMYLSEYLARDNASTKDRKSTDTFFSKPVNKNPRAIYDEAVKKFKAKEYESALDLFTAAFELYENALARANCKAGLASCYRDLKNYPQAITCCEEAIQLYTKAGQKEDHPDMKTIKAKLDGIRILQKDFITEESNPGCYL